MLKTTNYQHSKAISEQLLEMYNSNKTASKHTISILKYTAVSGLQLLHLFDNVVSIQKQIKIVSTL